MTERDYINVTELTRVRDAIAILSNICVENSECIDKEEFKSVGEIIHQWRERLEKKVTNKFK